MISPFPPARRHFVAAVILAALTVPLPAGTAVARKARPAKAAPAPARANDAIIALPLTPIVPAAQRLCASRTATGLGYTVLRAATGPRPATGDTVLVNYIGYLATTGAVFDQGMQSAFPVDGVIPGFSQGLTTMAKSGVMRFCIPAALGYGAQGTGPIPANADLVFQVELLDYKTKAEIEKLQAATDAPPPPTPQP